MDQFWGLKWKNVGHASKILVLTRKLDPNQYPKFNHQLGTKFKVEKHREMGM